MPSTSTLALDLIREQYGIDLTEQYAVDIDVAERASPLIAMQARAASACVAIAGQLRIAHTALTRSASGLASDVFAMSQVIAAGLAPSVGGDDGEAPAGVDWQRVGRVSELLAVVGALDAALRAALEMFPPPAPTPYDVARRRGPLDIAPLHSAPERTP